MGAGSRGLRVALAGSLLFGGVLTASLLVGELPASATSATLYVSTTGTGNCTSLANACDAISGAISQATSGAYTGDDVIIEVAAGTYFENDSLSVSSLSSLTIAGAGASSTVVNGGSLASVITVNSGTVIVSGLTVENGYVPNSSGGGIDNFGTTTVTNSVITGNTATGNFATGAGLNNDGSLSVSDSTVSDNSGGAGAGIYNFSGQLSVADSTITGNTTSLSGGGLSNASPGATATITDSTFSGNGASEGGALYVTRDTVTLSASTIVGNSAGNGGGIANFATLDMAGDILANNRTGSSDCGSFGSAVTDLGFNIADDGSCGFSATGSISNSSSLDASLAPLANNGGLTQTILPTPASPAAGAIPNPTTVDAIQLCPTTDQRGTASALNAACNMGAVQGTGLITPTTPVISNLPGSGVNGGGFTASVSTTGDGTTSVTSSTNGVCTASGLAVSYVGLGTCTLTAHVAAGPNYAAADGSPQSLTVKDTTSTSLSVNHASEVYGHEGLATFTVGVQTGQGETVPSGEMVTVAVGSAHCLVTLATVTGGGRGLCQLADTAVPAGSYTASASYPGDATLAGSGPATSPFTVTPALIVVSSVTPDTGYTTVQTPVTIFGSDFTGATAVDVDGVPATGVVVHSDTTITATLPTGAAGVADVTVTGPSGTSATTPADQFTYTVLATPTPPASCDPSCSVAVSTPLNGTTVQVSASSTSPTAKLQLVTNTGTLNCGTGYTYRAPVSTLTPSGFPAAATVTIKQTISGLPSTTGVKICFQAKGAPKPTFLPVCRTPKVAPCVLSVTKLPFDKVRATFLSPAKDPKWRIGAAGTVVTAISPLTGARGSSVTITGIDLNQVTSVEIGGAKALPKAGSTSTKLVVTVPRNAVSGYVSLTADSGTVTNTVKFKVT